MHIHHFMRHAIQQLLDKQSEVYLTDDEIQASKPIKDFFFGHQTPDLIVKSNASRPKPLLIYIHTEDTRATHRHFIAVMDSITVQPDSLLLDLLGVFPSEDLMRLHCHLQTFMAEYFKSRVLMNTIINVELPVSTTRTDAAQFALDLAEYVRGVMDRGKI